MVSDTVAQISECPIGVVLYPVGADRSQVRQNVCSPDGQQRADKLAGSNRAHAFESLCTGAAQKAHQNRFCLVVACVAESDFVGAEISSSELEKLKALFARPLFQVWGLRRELRSITHFERNSQCPAKRPHKSLVAFRLIAAQAMVEVSGVDAEFMLWGQRQKHVQQRYLVCPTRKPNENFFAGANVSFPKRLCDGLRD